MNKNRVIIKEHLKNLIDKEEVNASLIKMSTYVYTTILIEEKSGTLKISQRIFLNSINKDKLNDKQKDELLIILEKIWPKQLGNSVSL